MPCAAFGRRNEGRRTATTLKCPCGGAAEWGDRLEDGSKVVLCPGCGSYRLSVSAESVFLKGSVIPDPATFRSLVKQKRGTSKDYPLITEDDLKKATERRPLRGK